MPNEVLKPPVTASSSLSAQYKQGGAWYKQTKGTLTRSVSVDPGLILCREVDRRPQSSRPLDRPNCCSARNMATRLYFEGHAAASRYAATRPTMSAEILRIITSSLEKRVAHSEEDSASNMVDSEDRDSHFRIKKPWKLATDVGCGSGQYTQPLAPYFRRVLGFDASETQIQKANALKTAENVAYSVSPAESLPVDSGSVDLVLSATAAHWFDFPRFCAEVHRVLRPGGCLVVLGCVQERFPHQVATISAKLMEINDSFLNDKDQLGPYWPMTRAEMKAFYDNMDIDYTDQVRPAGISIRRTMNVDDFIEYTKTISASFQHLQCCPDTDLYEKHRRRLMGLLSSSAGEKSSDVHLTVEWVVQMMLAHKPGNADS
ncbi:putative methyltransferase DDB_G0268948 [Diadema antillarum]|uniref:putative methyltransferase DDB_G0268948 n=1 Tax=Diadema antillarum TaxID=105358 RepID=UPI003A866405